MIPTEAARALLAAGIIRAIDDVVNGDAEALAWLQESQQAACFLTWLELSPEGVKTAIAVAKERRALDRKPLSNGIGLHDDATFHGPSLRLERLRRRAQEHRQATTNDTSPSLTGLPGPS
jgi:hypothetical protein